MKQAYLSNEWLDCSIEHLACLPLTLLVIDVCRQFLLIPVHLFLEELSLSLFVVAIHTRIRHGRVVFFTDKLDPVLV